VEKIFKPVVIPRLSIFIYRQTPNSILHVRELRGGKRIDHNGVGRRGMSSGEPSGERYSSSDWCAQPKFVDPGARE
jgi:hypothetical protein